MDKKDITVVINGDDFGLTESCTKAIYDSFCAGIISSTTMVASGDFFERGLELVRNNSIMQKAIGVHFNLTEGTPISDPIKKCNKLVSCGKFAKYLRDNRYIPLTSNEQNAVYIELQEQILKLRSNGIDVCHADSHQHIHMNFNLTPIFIRVCKDNKILAMRNRKTVWGGQLDLLHKLIVLRFDLRLKRSNLITTNYFGNANEFTGLSNNGLYEIMVHPDYDCIGALINRNSGTLDNPRGVELEAEIARLGCDAYEKTTYRQLLFDNMVG